MSVPYTTDEKPRVSVDDYSLSSTLDDDRVLQEIGYAPSFKREFTNLATVSLSLVFAYIEIASDQFPFIVHVIDKLRIQHYGTMLERRYDVQHTIANRRTLVGVLVLAIGLVHEHDSGHEHRRNRERLSDVRWNVSGTKLSSADVGIRI